MSNLNVAALKRLFPKNTTRRQGGKVDGANRKRVQVMLPPDTLARLDELIEHDQQARSAAVALGVEVLCTLYENEGQAEVRENETAVHLLELAEHPYDTHSSLHGLWYWFRKVNTNLKTSQTGVPTP